jgi:hypothetical protein
MGFLRLFGPEIVVVLWGNHPSEAGDTLRRKADYYQARLCIVTDDYLLNYTDVLPIWLWMLALNECNVARIETVGI